MFSAITRIRDCWAFRAEAATAIALSEDPAKAAALDRIADGDVSGGLDDLAALADAAAADWRRIGELAYGADTRRALAAYQKVADLGAATVWDSIFLGRLYERAGNTAKALAVTTAALTRIIHNEEAGVA